MQCHVFIQEGGERSIVMAPAASALLNDKAVNENFGNWWREREREKERDRDRDKEREK